MQSVNRETRHYQLIEKAIGYLVANAREQPSLEEVAAQVHVSPFHLQRLFRQWVGVSPKRFLQYLSREHLRSRLGSYANLDEAAEAVGLGSASRVHDLFVTLDAMTPAQMRSGGDGLDIHYGVHDSPFGECLVAVTDRGVCALEFTAGDARGALQRLCREWPRAAISEAPGRTATVIERIFGNQPPSAPIGVLVKGTNFQIRVWEALLRIPVSALASYGDIAASLGRPAASRAVGTAIAGNPVAFLIPCHRVIRRHGVIGHYRWGEQRKAAMIGWEQALGAVEVDDARH